MELSEQRLKYLWKEFDSRRWGYLRQARVIARKGLQDSVGPVITLLNDRGVTVAYDNFDAFIDKDPLRDAYNKIYTMVAIPFARRSNEDLVGKMKQDEDWVRRVMQYLGIALNDRLDAVTLTSKNKISKILSMGIQEGASIQDMASRIASDVGGVSRATRIARTEVISASNLGSIEGARATGLPLDKVWLATRDNRTRETHSQSDGQRVAIDEVFNIGGSLLDFPGDWSNNASVAELVNCRCTVIYRVRR
jgi:hypothetical protein